MSDRLPDKKTPVVKEEVLEALWRAWLHLFGTAPKRESIWILLAQTALETGWMKSCHNYNLGNVKSREGDGFDYCYFACNEVLKRSIAEEYARKSPTTAKVTKNRSDGKSVIWFYPDHPGCRFRAFHTLLEGSLDHISIVHKRFSKAWPALLTGDPKQYSHMLNQQGYYTADVNVYTSSLVSIFGSLKKVPFDYSKMPTEETTQPDLNDEMRNRIQNLVTLTMMQSLDEILSAPSTLPTDDEDLA